MLKGKFVFDGQPSFAERNRIEVDFSPKGGPANLKGEWNPGIGITWTADGNVWSAGGATP